MADLQYHPSRLATALSRGTTRSVAVMVTFLTQPSVVERLAGVLSVLDEKGYDTVVFNVETAKQRDRHVAGLAGQHRADGIIVVSLPLAKAHIDTFKAAGLPVVIVDTETSGAPRFVIDNVDGGRLATDHLIGLGHRRIAFVGDSGDQTLAFSSSDRRLRGYRSALRDAGIESDRALIRITDGPRSADDGVSAAEALIANAQPPTAIFAASDVQAMRVLHAIEQRGLRVPDDISLIGFDDIEAAALARLSTVRQPLHESGVLAARRLCWLLDGNTGRPHRTVLPLELIHRGSTSVPRHTDTIRIERARRRPPPTPNRATAAAKSYSRAATRSRRASPSPPPSGTAIAVPGSG